MMQKKKEEKKGVGEAHPDKYDEEVARIIDTPRYSRDHSDWQAAITHAVSHVTLDGLWLEFGVSSGTSINFIAELTQETIYGFDSFYGINEEWNGKKKGAFSTNGVLPEVPSHVKLIKGMFEDTLSRFTKPYRGKAAFIHIDSDLYDPCKLIFHYFQPNIVAGTVIQFDEIFNGEPRSGCTYFDFKEHEIKAWLEFVEEYEVEYQWLNHAIDRSNAAVLITKKGKGFNSNE